MDILNTNELAIPDVIIFKYAKYLDNRGYFSESARISDIKSNFSENFDFMQINESFSKKGTIRGLHFQWDPTMGKLVRVIHGTMVDIVLDIRLGSPNFGKGLFYKMENNSNKETNEWIWVPPGFAHGNFFTEDTYIEYLCTAEYNPGAEASISPFAKDIDWSLADKNLKYQFDEIMSTTKLITDKDRDGYSVTKWRKNPNSNKFTFKKG